VSPTDPTNGRSRPRDLVARPVVPGPLGLLHPFPSGLNALAVATLALVAGGSAAAAAAAAVAMALLQTSIGCVNDLCDVEFDRIAHPGKPLPSGRVGRRTAIGYAIAAGVSGLGLATVLGPLAAAVAAGGFAIGLLYDAWLSRTTWSWLPFALGLPLVPAFGWAAARGELPAAFPELIVLGTLAGAALAIANGLADLDADAAVGGGGLAFQLGRRAALPLLVVLQTALVLLAAGVVLAGRPSPSSIAPLAVAVPVIVLGVVASSATSATIRERGWEAQAIGVALLAIAWLIATQPGVLA
jgi:4-hydroxybenzoate polyprenyltransferase